MAESKPPPSPGPTDPDPADLSCDCESCSSSENAHSPPPVSMSKVVDPSSLKKGRESLWRTSHDGPTFADLLSSSSSPSSPVPEDPEPPSATAVQPANPKGYEIVPEFWARDEIIESGQRRSPLCYLELFPPDPLLPAASSSQKPLKFDNLRYMKYSEIKHKLFAAHRLKELREGSTPQQSFTDQEILSEMTEHYGPMDTSSQKFKLMFQRYKSAFNEQLAACLASEEAFLTTPPDQIPYKMIDEGVAVLENKIKIIFSPEEIGMYDTLDPARNPTGADWVDVPRPSEAQSVEATVALLDLSDKEAEEVTPNLALFDPKYSDSRWATIPTDKVPLRLRQSLDKLIHEYPSGLNIDALFLRAEQRCGMINFRRMGFIDSWEFVKYMDDIFYINRYPEASLAIIFPASFGDFILPIRVICRRIAHAFMVALGENYGVIRLTDLMELVSGRDLPEGQNPFHYSDWGYSSRKAFVEDIMESNANLTDRWKVAVRCFLVKNKKGEEERRNFLICPEREETKAFIKTMKPAYPEADQSRFRIPKGGYPKVPPLGPG